MIEIIDTLVEAIQLGSFLLLEECRYYLILAHDLGYGDTNALIAALEETSRLLHAYSAAILTSGS